MPNPPIRFLSEAAPDGVLRLNVEINVDLNEFATWPPAQINAFFDGIAKALYARHLADMHTTVRRAAQPEREGGGEGT